MSLAVPVVFLCLFLIGCGTEQAPEPMTRAAVEMGDSLVPAGLTIQVDTVWKGTIDLTY